MKRTKTMFVAMALCGAIGICRSVTGAPTEAKRQYCVIDISAGPKAAAYPVAWLDAPPPGGFNADLYKTGKVVLRRIESGSFKMGGGTDVTLTKPYCMGIFEVTQRQYELVMGCNPSSYKGEMRPVEHVGRKDVRGDSAAFDWPKSSDVAPDSFVGRLRKRTGLKFDLPTEAQWEYACRAGTAGSYNGTGEKSDLKYLGRYKYNGGHDNAHATVGSYLPNAWGLYDMHGKVWEMCLDWQGHLAKGKDPTGPAEGTYRILRGGGWTNNPNLCTSAWRHSFVPVHAYSDVGVRLALVL